MIKKKKKSIIFYSNFIYIYINENGNKGKEIHFFTSNNYKCIIINREKKKKKRKSLIEPH
jgi:hypothetical protein